LLDNIKIDHRNYEYTPKNINHSKVHIIRIHKKQSRLQFMNKIGFWHSKKTNALIESLNLNKDIK
jgi:hypothetical protein